MTVGGKCVVNCGGHTLISAVRSVILSYYYEMKCALNKRQHFTGMNVEVALKKRIIEWLRLFPFAFMYCYPLLFLLLCLTSFVTDCTVY